MGFNFPSPASPGQIYAPPGGPVYRFDDPIWTAVTGVSAVTGSWLPVTPEMYGAKADGVTDDSAAFTAALAASKVVTATPGRSYAVKDVVVNGSTTLDMNGSRLVPVDGAKWLVRLTGWKPAIINAGFDDIGNKVVRSTTLGAGVAALATSFTVVSPSGLEVGMIATVLMDNARWHISPITAIAGTTITVARAFETTATSGAVVDCSWGMLNIRGMQYARADNLQFVNTSFGIVNDTDPLAGTFYISNVKGAFSNIYLSDSPHVGFFVGRNCADTRYQTIALRGGRSVTTNATGDGTTDTFNTGSVTWRKTDTTITVDGVSKTQPTHWTYLSPTQIQFTAGNIPAASAAISIRTYLHGKSGLCIDATGWTVIRGGDTWSVIECLAWKRGIELHQKTLTSFDQIISDTNSGEALLIDNGSLLSFGDLFLGYSDLCLKATGANVNVSIDGPFWTKNVSPTSDLVVNTTSPYAIDNANGSALSINVPGWRIGSDKTRALTGNYIWMGSVVWQIAGNATVAAGSTVYFGPAGLNTATGLNYWMAERSLRLVRLLVYNGTAPGAGKKFTYTVQYDGVDTAVTGICSDSSFSVDLPFDFFVSILHRVQLKIVTDAATPTTSFRGFMELI